MRSSGPITLHPPSFAASDGSLCTAGACVGDVSVVRSSGTARGQGDYTVVEVLEVPAKGREHLALTNHLGLVLAVGAYIALRIFVLYFSFDRFAIPDYEL